MRSKAPAASVLTVCFLAISTLSFAGGGPEKMEGTSFKAYVLLPETDGRNELSVTSTLLPPVAGLYGWSSFTMKDGVPQVSSDNTFSTTSRNVSSGGKLGAFRVMVYEMSVVFTGAKGAPAAKTVRMAFDLADITTASGQVSFQPAAWAALEAARRSGKRAGSLRVLETVPTAGNGFKATVELR